VPPKPPPAKQKTAQPAKPAPLVPPPPPVPELLPLDDDESSPAPVPSPSDDPFAFASSPEPAPREDSKSKIKKKTPSNDVDEEAGKSKHKNKKSTTREEKEIDPFQTPFSAAPETVAENDPFSFNSDPTPSVKAKTNKQERDEEEEKPKPRSKQKPPPPERIPEAANESDPFAFSAAPAQPEKPKSKKQNQDEEEEKPKPRGKQKPPPPEDEPEALSELDSAAVPAASNDPFSFNPAPSSHNSKARIGNKRIAQDYDRDGETDGQSGDEDDESSNRGARKYGRQGEKKSNKLLLLAGVMGFLALGAIVAAVVVFFSPSKEPEKPKTTEKKDEPAPTPPPSDPPQEDPKTAKKDTGKKDTGKKDGGKKDTGKKDTGDTPPKEPKLSPDQPAGPVAMLALPKDISRYSFRAPKDKPESTQVPSGVPIQADVAFDKVKRFFPSPDRVKSDAVVVWQSNPGFNGRGEKLTVDAYSGSTGSKVGRFEFDGDGKDVKCDVSIDGKVFVAAADGKVTVWNLADKTKVIDGFDPYSDKPNHKKAGLAAVYAPAISSNFLTVSTAGAMHLFEIGTKRLLGEYIPEKAAPGRVVQGKNLAVDESRSSVVVSVAGAIHQVKTIDLTLAWKLPIGGEAGRSFGISVAGTPGRIAYAFETDADKKKERAILFCLPNSDFPKIFRWQDSAGEPTSVSWSGTEFAVVGTTKGAVWFEYDSEGKNFTPLAMALVPNDKGLHDATEHAHWYLIPNPKDPSKSLMLELATPIQDLTDFREQAAGKKPLETLRLDDKGLWR
jgi:hypothetical protein